MNATTPEPAVSRRPIAARNTAWAAAIARKLAGSGIKPNTISVFSSVFAALGAIGFVAVGYTDSAATRVLALALAVAGMQLRLLCNLFDGMVAVEGGHKTKSGEVFNELPDRFSDAFLFVGAGYALPQGAWLMPQLGWLSALLAVSTAYVRAMGVAAGGSQQFCGPMAKQQRMAVLTVACIVAMGSPWMPGLILVIPLALGVIAVGSLITVFRRTARIIRDLESQ